MNTTPIPTVITVFHRIWRKQRNKIPKNIVAVIFKHMKTWECLLKNAWQNGG